MSVERYSVAIPERLNDELRGHLMRADGQEDVCLVFYAVSTGRTRRTAILRAVEKPETGERQVHGNASFTGEYMVRAATLAAERGEGLALVHSHPRGRGWQGLSVLDRDAESSYSYLVREITGYPLVGMTHAGADGGWSARTWDNDGPLWAESVRVVGNQLSVTWNDRLRPPVVETGAQLRTVSAWGEDVQQSVARLRVLVVGAGSVGLDVVQRLAAAGVQEVGVMDFDSVEEVNLDRMIGATPRDVRLHRSKVEVAARLALRASTTAKPRIVAHETSVCDPDGFASALDYDIVFSCVDRPWPRAVLNQMAYSDLIPVIDGGIAIDAFPDGGMRGASWRSHVVMPGRRCLACNGQVRLAEVPLDRDGSLDDPTYIAGARPKLLTKPGNQNVALLSGSVSASLLVQFVSLVVAPGGQGEPGPLQYHLAGHALEHLPTELNEDCLFELREGVGDRRTPLTQRHAHARRSIADRRRYRRRLTVRADELLERLARALLRQT